METKLQDLPATSEQVEEKSSTSQSNEDPCGGTGWIADAEGYRKKCPACSEKARIRRIDNGIPGRFVFATFGNYKPKNEKQVDALKLMRCPEDEFNPEIEGIGNFFIVGDYGSGKTHLLYAQYRAEATRGDIACFVRSTKELLRELNNDEMDKEPSELLEAIKERRDEVHLFWDDADKFKVTDFKLEALFDLIDSIYKHHCGLTVTSNLDLAELQEKLSPAICRRIDDICKKIEL